MPFRTVTVGAALVAAIVFAVAESSAAPSDLNPPPGPVQPTGVVHIPETNGSTVVIDMPGKYVLDGPVTGPAGGDPAIRITVGNVKLDLNGQTVTNGPGAFSIVQVDALMPVEQIVVRNGTLTGDADVGFDAPIGGYVTAEELTINAAFTGLNLGDGSAVVSCTVAGHTGPGIIVADYCTILGTHSISNGGVGIQGGRYITVEDSSTQDNGGAGLDVEDNAHIKRFLSDGNGADGVNTGAGAELHEVKSTNNTGHGVRVGPGSNLHDVTSTGNGDFGVLGDNNCAADGVTSCGNTGAGVAFGSGSSVTRGRFEFNDRHGVFVQNGAVIADTVATGNGAGFFAGVETGESASLENVVAVSNTARGVVCGPGSTLRGCVANGNGTASAGSGFSCDSAVLQDCSARGNNGNGFDLTDGCRARGCESRENAGHGYFLIGSCVTDCGATQNGQEGYWCDGDAGCARDCTSSFNSGEGVYVVGNSWRVDGMHVIGNTGAGLLIDFGIGNWVVRCTGEGNGGGNFLIINPLDNKVAPVAADPALAGPWDNMECP